MYVSRDKAARDLTKLQRLGKYGLRQLARELNLIGWDGSLSCLLFTRLELSEQAEKVLAALQVYDAHQQLLAPTKEGYRMLLEVLRGRSLQECVAICVAAQELLSTPVGELSFADDLSCGTDACLAGLAQKLSKES